MWSHAHATVTRICSVSSVNFKGLGDANTCIVYVNIAVTWTNGCVQDRASWRLWGVWTHCSKASASRHVTSSASKTFTVTGPIMVTGPVVVTGSVTVNDCLVLTDCVVVTVTGRVTVTGYVVAVTGRVVVTDCCRNGDWSYDCD